MAVLAGQSEATEKLKTSGRSPLNQPDRRVAAGNSVGFQSFVHGCFLFRGQGITTAVVSADSQAVRQVAFELHYYRYISVHYSFLKSCVCQVNKFVREFCERTQFAMMHGCMKPISPSSSIIAGRRYYISLFGKQVVLLLLDQAPILDH